MPEFVHLHNHSEFSLLRATSTVKGLIKAAQKMAMPALAITDDGNLFGALRFYKACQDSAKSDNPDVPPQYVKPIIGCDFFMSYGSRLERGNNENANRYTRIVLLAKNDRGYRHLCQLSSLGYTEGFYYRPRIDKEALAEHHQDLVALSGGIGGEIPQLLSRNRYADAKLAAAWYAELFGKDHFYLELTDHGITEQKVINEGLLQLSKELDLPVVAANDCYYVSKSDSKAHDVLLCIGNKRKVADPSRFRFSSNEFYLKSADEMAAIFGHVEGALSNSLKIAEMVALDLWLPGPLLPDYEVPAEFTAQAPDLVGGDVARLQVLLEADPAPDAKSAQKRQEAFDRLQDSATQYFIWLSAQGLRKRFGPKPADDLLKRLDYELYVIIRMGFVGYFLIVWDFIKYAKDHDIPVGPGRGSGAGSIVAFSLEITDIDPIRYNLLFERFLNPERVSMPDFDIDFCFERRHEVIEYVTQKYGNQRTGQIITFGTLKPKAALKDVARALDISFDEANQIVKCIPDGPSAAKLHIKDLLAPSLDPKWVEAGFKEQAEAAKEIYSRGGIYQELFDFSIALEGLSRHTSLHAAGVVIGKEILTTYLPLYKDPKTGGVATQYTMDLLEECGLVKMDFLGLKTLTLLKNSENLVKKTAQPEFDISAVTDNDRATFRMLGEGKSSAVFQFDGEGMQKTLKLSKPNSIEDLTALTSLYRPGPMEFIPQFADSKSGRQAIAYPHPALEPILKETYGVMVYQEQVMQAAQIMAGYTLGGADLLRRAMGKKKKEEMDKQRAIFCAGAAKVHGLAAEKANVIFDILDKFAGYGFNKSHAAAYSVVSYRTAYLKANFPAQFMAANLTNEINNPDNFRKYLTETRGMGIDVVAPDLNSSDKMFTVVGSQIVFGLVGIKGIGDAVVDEIIRERSGPAGPFKDIGDFLDRVDLRTVNRKSIEILIQTGCFDRIAPSRKSLLDKLEVLLAAATARKDGKRFGQTGLFDDAPQEEFPEIPLDSQEFDLLEKLRLEKELLGYYFSGHPLDQFRSEWERATTLDLSRPENADPEKKYNLVAMLANLRVMVTKKGSKMGVGLFEDYNGSLEAVFFARALEQFQDKLLTDTVMGLICRVDFKRDEPQLIVEEIREPGALEEKDAGEVHIRLQAEAAANPDALHELACTMFEKQGRCSVYLHVLGDAASGKETLIRAGFTISSRERVLAELRDMLGVAEVWKIYPAMLAQARKRKLELPREDSDSVFSSAAEPQNPPTHTGSDASGFDADADSSDAEWYGEYSGNDDIDQTT